ncbi:MAG: M18 family aminopeptidase [Spirochaetaceae bacterium]|nr:MAG: M18 family aminopeptidase [Spirochaetaceae bacterium]
MIDRTDIDSFLTGALTPYHAVHEAARRLGDAGFQSVAMDSRWDNAWQGRWMTTVGAGGLIAFDPGNGALDAGLAILAAHTDSPSLRIKERAVAWKHGALMLPTEVYGGPIRATWLDRPLTVAGIAVCEDGTVSLIRLHDEAVIPNLAIHLNRKVNDGFEYNPHDHLVALLRADAASADKAAVESFLAIVAEQNPGCRCDQGGEVELYLVDGSPPARLGDGSICCAPRLDNLVGCYTCLRAIVDAKPGRPRLMVLYNHEEIGSQTGEGAQSDLLRSVIDRIATAHGADREDRAIMLARSTIVSNDAAHAIHPSFADKSDTRYAPRLGGGPVLKINGTYRYATTATTGALFARACTEAGVPMQRLANRSDLPSGSTVGPLSWARTGIKTVDVGIPLLAMHSIRETASYEDFDTLARALTAFVETSQR